jgi:CRISPR type IV-associated protein Csf3
MDLTTASRVELKSGRYKAYHMPIWYCHAAEVSWRIVADPRWVEQLLAFAHSLGKKRAHGWGHVNRWRVEDAGAPGTLRKDWAVRDDEGLPLRAIPREGGMLHGFRPSYWMPSNQAPCEIPRLG